MKDLIVVRENVPVPAPGPADEVVPFETFRGWIKSGALLARFCRYNSATLLCVDNRLIPRPALTAFALRWASKRDAYLKDLSGAVEEVSWPEVGRRLGSMVGDRAAKAKVLDDVEALLKEALAPAAPVPLKPDGPCLYLRSDLTFGLRAGGSVAHTAGVLNNLADCGAPPIFVTTDAMPTVDDSIETHLIRPDGRFWDLNDFPSLAFNRPFLNGSLRIAGGRKPAFVYQRYSKNNLTGLVLSRRLGVPFVLEYNGSELWVNRHWGGSLPYESQTRRIEEANLHGASLVVVVSRPSAEELAGRGVDRKKILVNPNGVDIERYHPEIDGGKVRARMGFSGRVVVGFIGTFGPWHGAEILAEAAVKVAADPALKEKVRFLFVGDGMRRAATAAVFQRAGLSDLAAFTGQVAQKDAPPYLAACDILASPTVGNPDGTPFFGSPTKLFEYMAMGRAIVASRLDQLEEVISHGESGFLTRPGDVDDVAAAIRSLAEDEGLRFRLGKAARASAEANHSWLTHTRRIVDALRTVASRGSL